jgi:hypothetical protein
MELNKLFLYFLTTCSAYLLFNSSLKVQDGCMEYSEMVQCMHLMQYFKSIPKKHNEGVSIGLIWAAGT